MNKGLVWALVGTGAVVILITVAGMLAASRRTGETEAEFAEAEEERDPYSLERLPASLAGKAADVRSLVQPCVNLRAEPAKAALPLAASKFGGVPCLRPGVAWPKCKSGKPMTFIGQLNFAEILKALRERAAKLPAEMPRKGLLLFFYDMEEMTWGGDPGEERHWLLRWEPRPETVKRPPAAPRQQDAPKRCRLVPAIGLTLPDFDDEVYTLPGLSDKQTENYIELCEDLRRGLGHQVLGHAATIQNDPRQEARSGGDKVFSGKATGLGWRLLWQIGSDEAPGFMWGDSGAIYIMIRSADLRAGRFNRLWLVSQCY